MVTTKRPWLMPRLMARIDRRFAAMTATAAPTSTVMVVVVRIAAGGPLVAAPPPLVLLPLPLVVGATHTPDDDVVYGAGQVVPHVATLVL